MDAFVLGYNCRREGKRAHVVLANDDDRRRHNRMGTTARMEIVI